MAKMTQTQARKRMREARQKIMAVYTSDSPKVYSSIKGQDVIAFDKLFDKIIARLGGHR